MATFYLSSTYEDLKDCRREVVRLLRRRGHDVLCMEDYGPSGRPPLSTCLEDVARCDVYVGIIAWRYGFVPAEDNPDEQSITELEYRHAKKSEKECWIFLLAPDAPWPVTLMDTDGPGERVKAFRAELSARHVVCFFKDCKELGRKAKAAMLKRFPSGAHSLRARLAGLLPAWPWYVTAPAALFVLLLLATLALAVHYWRLSPRERAEFLIKTHARPAPFTDPLEDYFDLPPGANPDAAQCVPPNENVWDYPAGQWCLVRTKFATKPGSGTLSVRGPDWGVRKDLGDKALYDFEMKFVVIFEKGDKAAWVLRSREDKRSGYVFMLERSPGGDDAIRVFLHAWAYTRDGKHVALGSTPHELQLGRVYDSDYFVVTVTAVENVFWHKIRIQNPTGKDPNREPIREPHDDPGIRDRNDYFPYGSVGFFAPGEGGEIQIDNFQLTPLGPQAPTAPTPTDGG